MTVTDARRTYDAFAASFDDFNRRYQYRRWTGVLLGCAEEAGLQGWRLLDVGCGTGLSFIALLERGFRVTGCDISPAMLAQARAKAGDSVELLEADMRCLPVIGGFDLIWSLNDAMNYLMDEGELSAALAGIRRNLAPGGVVLFDANTLAGYRGFWSHELVVEGEGGRRFVWRGLAGEVRAGGVFESSYHGVGEGVEAHRHRQRHFGEAQVLAAIRRAGLREAAVLGEYEGELSAGIDEDHHTKAVYVCVAQEPTPRRPGG